MDPKNSILIVDDSKENIDQLRSILDMDYDVYVALSGEVALSIMERVCPDLVLLDVVMPGLGGFDVLEHMNRAVKLMDIPVIFITGATDSFNEAKGLQLGAVDYISKPYHSDIVCIKVRNQIQNKMNKDRLEKQVEQRTQELAASRRAAIIGMSLLAESRNPSTRAHIQRMQKYTEMLAFQVHMNTPRLLPRSELSQIVLYVPLHDIGNVSIPDSILHKKEPLTAEESAMSKMHTKIGADILRETQSMITAEPSMFRVAIEIAHHHHERYDGSGYPDGLTGDEIPISARIVTLTNAYDALVFPQQDKQAYSHEEACTILLQGGEGHLPSHFDPDILHAFDQIKDQFAAVFYDGVSEKPSE